MLPSWFLWAQVATCLGAAAALAWDKQLAFSWTWFCYAAANLGWIYGTSNAVH